MIKKLTIALIIACLLLVPFFSSIPISQAQSSPLLSLVPSTVQITNPSETFELAFKISDVTNLWGWMADVTWDSQYLEMTKNPVQGDFYQESETQFTYSVNKIALPRESARDAYGTATANEVTLERVGKSGSGSLVIFTFKVLKPVVSTIITVNATRLLSPAPTGSGGSFSNPPIDPYPAVTYATATVSYIPSDGSPVANAGLNQTVNQFTSVTLDASQTLPQDVEDQTYTWAFTDNASRILTGKIVNYKFDWPGVIPVTLTVTNSKGTSTAIIGITVVSITPPVPVIHVEGYSGQTINVAVNQGIVFYNQSYDPYNLPLKGTCHWDFGDGETSNMADVGHRYSASGTYVVSLTVTNSADLNATATKTIVVGDGVTDSPPSSGEPVSSSDGTNALDRSANQGGQQNTLNLPPTILYPLIFVTVFAISGAVFWLRKNRYDLIQ